MSFKEYLHSKKIDAARFKKEEPGLWSDLEIIFDQVSPKSFTTQKFYLINPIRRKYPWNATATSVTTGKQGKPPIKPKTKDISIPQMKPKTASFKPKAAQDTNQEVIKSERDEKPRMTKPKIKPKLVKPKAQPKENPKTSKEASDKKPKMAKPIIKRPKKE